MQWGEPDVEYTLRIEVNRDIDGREASKMVTAIFREGDTIREQFDKSYDSFPYQPSSVLTRFGLNTHGANWTARDLRIGYIE